MAANKEMNILMVFSSSELGGAERSLTRMALASSPNIYQLATLDGEGPWCDWVRRQGQTPLIFGIRSAAQHGRPGLRAFLALIRYVRNGDLQVVYVCGIRASLWLRLLRPLMPGVKLVHGIRTNPDSNSRLDKVIRLVERQLGGLVDLYISNSQIAATTLVERCGVHSDKIRVIYNGLADVAVDTLPLSDRPLNVLTVANLIPYKGHLEYLLAIKTVLQEIPNVHFTFIGRDDMNGKVQSAIREWKLSAHVTCVGFQEDISSWMKDARLLVLPSLKEGVPTTVLEAMSYGVPVIAYNLGGLPELIRHEQDGLLVPAKDTKCLAMGIIKLLREKDYANRMSISSLTRSKTEFQLNTCVMKHQKALLSLIKRS